MSSDLQLRMVLTLAADAADRCLVLPPCPLYYEIWTYEGDVEVLPRKWCDLINTCFPNRERPFDEHQFVEKFASQPQFDPAGFFLITTRSTVVGTAFAWQDNPADDTSVPGRLHWLAVHPEHRRKGIGKLLVTLVVEHFRKRGHREVALRTQGHRVAAIRLYQDLGFVLDQEFGDGHICAKPLRLIKVPCGALLGFKACPGSDASQMLEHCASHDNVSHSRDPVWSGIYVQLSLAQAINYLPNQYERPRGHPLFLYDRLASVVELRVASKSGLQVALSDDPRLCDTRISNHNKAWLIFDQMRRTWPGDEDGLDVRERWARLKAEDKRRNDGTCRAGSASAYTVPGGVGAAAVEANIGSRPVTVMDSFASKDMALCLMDAENYELCFPHSLFHLDVLQTKTLLCFPESQEVPGCIGSVEFVAASELKGSREDDACQNLDASLFSDILRSKLSSKWDLFDAARLSTIVQETFATSGAVVQATWHDAYEWE